ncbi:hypothetical protein [Persephonella sp.]
MPKFKSPHYIADKLIQLYEKIEKPILIDFNVLTRISGRENIFRPLKRKIFTRVSEVLEEKGYIMFEIPEEEMIAIVKKEFALNRWNYLDEEDLDDISDYVEEEILAKERD